MAARYTGKLLITGFAAADKEDFEQLLQWQTLSFENLDVGYNPMQFRVKGISLSDFFAAVTIESDGSLNLHQLVVPREVSRPEEAKVPPKTPETKRLSPPETSNDMNVEIGGEPFRAEQLRIPINTLNQVTRQTLPRSAAGYPAFQ